MPTTMLWRENMNLKNMKEIRRIISDSRLHDGLITLIIAFFVIITIVMNLINFFNQK